VAAVKSAGISRVALFATTGLIQSEIYQKAMAQAGIESLTLPAAQQKRLMDQILTFKDRGDGAPLLHGLQEQFERMRQQGAEGIALACTDIPVVLEGVDLPLPCFDTTEILALAAIREARGEDREP